MFLNQHISGTYICVEQLMRCLDNPNTNCIDVFHAVYQLRKDRYAEKALVAILTTEDD